VEQDMVALFHRTFDILVNDKPTVADAATRDLRISLIREESKELEEALEKEDVVGIADALADLLYVVYGTAVSLGLDMEPIFAEVHRSNMTKVGGHKREDGKWIKPETYEPPDLAPIIEDMSEYGPVPDYPLPAKEDTTCFRCAENTLCKYAWDPYNTDGDCLADK